MTSLILSEMAVT